MADLLDSTQDAEDLANELRTLHERREREPLSAEDEARYAELWAWWQRGAGGPSTRDGGGCPGAAEPELGGFPEPGTVDLPELESAPDAPQEWLEAFAVEEQQVPDPAAPVAGEAADVDLVREWEAWQAKQRDRGDPFDMVPDEPSGASYDELMSARAEALGVETDVLVEPEEPSPDVGALPVEKIDTGAEQSEPRQPAPEAAPLPQRDSPPSLQGARRVVIHLADGQVRRGQVLDVEVSREAFSYIGAGGTMESVPRSDVRTVFFMRAPGLPSCGAEGVPIRVTLRDGRELTGTSADHDRGGESFTVVPEGGRSNAALVWVARSAVRSVTSGG